MEHCTSEPMAAAWYLPGAAEPEGGLSEPEAGAAPDKSIPNVIIAVSLDELDGLSGDMLM